MAVRAADKCEVECPAGGKASTRILRRSTISISKKVGKITDEKE
jgi:hypothetical protein